MERSEVEAAPVVIEADSVVKKFGGVTAVNDVSVSVREGEIYGLIGENGAGKSTLMRMLAGLYTPDSGEVRVLGKTLDGAKSALEAGIAIVHQELNLIPEMTVAENIMLGSFPTSGGFTETKKLKAVAKETLEEIGVPIDLNEPVSRLSVALRQFVEIARAIARKPRVLIMDEPTASLTPAETDYLLAMLQRLAGRGMSVVYISHRLPEIFRICNRVSVLRDGALVDTMPIDDTNPEDLVTKMVGRELKLDLEVRRESTPGDVVLSARGITAPQVRNVDLQVRAGEIVGLGGLVGAGRTELVRAVLGVDPKSAGEVTMTVDGKKKRITNYGEAVAHGAAYVPEERRTEGLALTMTVSDNIALPNRRRLSSSGVLKVGSFDGFASALADKVGLRPPDVTRAVGEYSGGNQQKVVIAKWLGREPRLIVLDEPTRGVDVGAKAEIHRLVRELADGGAAVLVVSSDLPELLDLSDVIHVIRDGQVAGTLTAEQADEKAVMTLAAGGRMVASA
ncbi:MAG: sugar ABC transporter ATP-binding protein [Mycobacterium sp.]